MTASAAATPAMTHERALDIATAAPAFRPTDDEGTELTAHLAVCPDCARRVARLRTDLAAIGRVDPPVSPRLHDRIREVAATAPRTGPSPSPIGLALVLGLLVLGVVGAAAGVGAFQAARIGRPAPNDVAANDRLHWVTDAVTMAARDFWIEANGQRFTGVAKPELSSSPGTDNWTLEAIWQEHGGEQRLFLYFDGDASSWWINQIGVYDGGVPRPEWATFAGGPWVKTPRGQAFAGALDVTGTSATGPVTLHLDGLRIAVHPVDIVNEPLGGGITLRGDADDPFRPGGELACSGILQLPPQAAEAQLVALGYKLSWRFEHSTGPNTADGTSSARAPVAGFISLTAVGTSGELIVFVQDPSAPAMQAATLPPDCAAGS